ncbi:MAG: hypothetical protein KGJ55_00885 [Gammaproteobacteria bacterium]|nr:hypothetical protein [Gammaproteobacteria bacterium]
MEEARNARFSDSSATSDAIPARRARTVWGLLLRPYLPLAISEAKASPAPKSATFDTLTVQRINIVDPDGRTRLVIANSKRFPDAVVRGKAYKRSIHDTAGLAFYDVNGGEIGGLALSKLRDEDQTALIFDYIYQPTDGIWMGKSESPDGARWRAGFGISDRRPYKPGDIKSSQGVERISLSNENQNAQLVISDPQGHPRIRIGVNKAGEPRIEMLDPNGKVVYRAR